MREKTKKLLNFTIVFFLLLSTLIPIHSVSAEGFEAEAEIAGYIEAITDANVYDEQDQELGQILADTQIGFHSIEDDKVYFYWNDKLAYVNKQDVSELSGDQELSYVPYEGDSSPQGILSSEELIEVYEEADLQSAFAKINSNTEYSVIGYENEQYFVLVSNRLGYVDGSQVNYQPIEVDDNETDQHQEQTRDDIDSSNQVEETSEETSQETSEETSEENGDTVESEQDESQSHLTETEEEENTENASASDEVVEEAAEAEQEPIVTKSEENTDRPFTSSDRFFEVTERTVSVYDNRTGKLVHVGYLQKGEVYPRVRDYGDWHEIKYGEGFGYIWKAATKPADGSQLKNINSKNEINSNISFTAIDTLGVFDNSSGKLVQYASIFKGVEYPIISQMGDWYKIDLAGRIGYVYKPATKLPFKGEDKFFEVTDRVSVYDNRTGKLVHVGYLNKGQVFPRIRDYGDWHEIKYGNGLGYIWKDATKPASGSNLKNLNTKNVKNSNTNFQAIDTLAVYDNTSGQLVQYASIFRGVEYPLISQMGDWYKIDLAGRIGYVYKPATKIPFTTDDRYFEVVETRTPIYDNSSGSFVQVGSLQKGQVFPRVRDFGEWHEIQYGRGVGYVLKDATRPANGTSIVKSENKGILKQSSRSFTALTNLAVSDNTSGKLVHFATINEGESYPIIGDLDKNWLRVEIAGRIGYVYRPGVQEGPIQLTTNYNLTLTEALNKQLALQYPPPQTDYKYRTYAREDGFSVDDASNPTKGTVIVSRFNVRGGPSLDYWVVGTISNGTQIDIISKEKDSNGYWWYEFNYNRVWVNASPDHVREHLDPQTFVNDDRQKYQFLVLSKRAGANAQELNDKVLYNRGVLAGHGEAFIEASVCHNVNEFYLMSHAFLETGNGKSSLARGILVDQVGDTKVEPKVVYNMYGVGALDKCAYSCGAEYAYTQGWFTPEDAIIGGAKFIADRYVYGTYKQDTPYKMRWNPVAAEDPNRNANIHQYATDIGWARKQALNVSNWYNNLTTTRQPVFDIPQYK